MPHAVSYTRAHRAMELAAMPAAALLFAAQALRLWLSSRDAADLCLVLACVGLGYLAADLASGAVHWIFDRFGSVHTPLLGAKFIRPFREHHDDPLAITRHGFVETNGDNCIVALPVLAGALFLPIRGGVSLVLVAVLSFMCLFVLLTGQIHKWAHMESPPRPARWLQRARLILSREHHEIHHGAPFRRAYCITSGWWNPLLDALRAFHLMEAVIGFFTGARPRPEAEAPAAAPAGELG